MCAIYKVDLLQEWRNYHYPECGIDIARESTILLRTDYPSDDITKSWNTLTVCVKYTLLNKSALYVWGFQCRLIT